MNNTQICRKCNTDKPLMKFHKDKRTPNKRRTTCNDCRNMQKRVTNISSNHRKDLLEEQNNSCAICGINGEELKRKLSVDHNHETNQVRGLLCNSCNLGLGQFKDSVVFLSCAIEYLERYDGIA
jgi:protein-arginine kinase activator protein McsA